MTKERRAPEVLRRAYGERVRTLADAIISSLPPPLLPSNCPCDLRRCLRCVGPPHRPNFLLHHSDPPDYRQLLKQSFAVVSDRAPPLAAFDPIHRTQQRDVVLHVIEKTLSGSFKSCNMICDGYDKIGDEVMVHFLKFSSIFLLLPSKGHYQVTGWPLYKYLVSNKMSKCATFGKQVGHLEHKISPATNHAQIGARKKRGVEIRDESNVNSTVYVQGIDNLMGTKNSLTRDDCDRPKKRVRPSSWQRRRKRRNMDSHSCDIATQENVLKRPTVLGNSSERLLHDKTCTILQKDLMEKVSLIQEPDEKSLPCFCLLMLRQTHKKSAREGQIEKRWMFYNSSLSRSLFPRNHILSRLKPNDKGAISLMRNIFGLHGGDISLSFFQNSRFCPIRSKCLFHSLLDLLKSLIRRAHRCQYLKIFSKHCLVPTSKPCHDSDGGVMSKEYEFDSRLPLFRVFKFRKKYKEFKSSSSLPPQKSYGHVNQKKSELPTRTQIFDNQFEDLNGSYCQYNQVVSFIWAICRSIVPLNLLGDSSNWRALRRNISKLVQLRRFEKFSMKQCKYGLKTLHVPFLAKVTQSSCCGSAHQINDSHILKIKLFERWVFWFFSRLVVPVVAAHFYVTESEAGRLNVFYFQKRAWKKISEKAISHMSGRTHHLMDPTWLRLHIRKRTFGFSKIRFLPKKNGVRPLANLKSPSSVLLSDRKFCLKRKYVKATPSEDWEVIKFKAVNSNLRDLHAILKRLKVENPEKLSSSVFDYNDIYKKLCPFIIGVRSRSLTMPGVFVVICDVWKAFDTINQDKLLLLMNEVLHKNEYCFQKFAHVLCTKEYVRVHYDQVSVDPSSSRSITKFSALVPSSSGHSVLINQFRHKRVSKATLLQLLHEHVKANLLQLGPYLYSQQVGIPQGSVLSSLLCSFYYSHLEEHVIFPWLQRTQKLSTLGLKTSGLDDENLPEYVLLRLIDDFLFISTSKKQATSFFSRFQRGFREYNCSMNNGKFCMNFDVVNQSGDTGANRVYTGEDGVSFLPWSGLLVNCSTLEIQADYTRYLGTHLTSTLTVSNQANSGCHLKKKLCDYMRPKCHPLFYDSNINSSGTVLLNVYQAFLLCAMKFHCYICQMPSYSSFNADFCLEIIRRSTRYKQKQFAGRYMYKLIKKRMCSMKLNSNLNPVLKLRLEEVVLLGLSAYIRVLKKKQSRHAELLKLLRSKVRIGGEVSTDDMKYALDDSHSSVFWKIKF